MTVTVPADVWEGEGATLSCSPDVDKANVALLLWYKNTDVNIVYGYSSSDARANNDLKNRAVGQWVGSVHQLHITKTEFSDEATYICESGSGKDSKKLTVNGKYLEIMWLMVKTTKIFICPHFNKYLVCSCSFITVRIYI